MTPNAFVRLAEEITSSLPWPPIYLDGQRLSGKYTVTEETGGRMKVTMPDGRWGWVTTEGKLSDPDLRFVLHLVT